ncbi:helix-turn-helix domain-containing protein [Cellulomonas sp. 179-A 4D5 NHS]|uniref:helix-turn-helix domain-containing protein n=1 Tax=Cellulomonas sp. 179-A 4D5 NHS TaxID=3142378 RepID=UPI00399F14A9
MTTPTPSSPAWLSVAEVARTYRLPPRTVHDLVAAGTLPGFKVGRGIRIPVAQLDERIRGAKVIHRMSYAASAAEAPPLTAAQRDRLRTLLRPDNTL